MLIMIVTNIVACEQSEYNYFVVFRGEGGIGGIVDNVNQVVLWLHTAM